MWEVRSKRRRVRAVLLALGSLCVLAVFIGLRQPVSDVPRQSAQPTVTSAVTVVATAPLPAPPLPPPTETSALEFVPAQLLVKFKPAITTAAKGAVLAAVGGLQRSMVSKRSGIELFIFAPDVDIEAIVEQLSSLPEIAFAEPDYIFRASAIESGLASPSDPSYDQLWGLHNTGQDGGVADIDIDAREGWRGKTGGDAVVVVIDSGIDYNHVDLRDNIWVNPGEIAGNGIDDDGNGYIDDIHGIDTVNNDSDPFDDHGHGTLIAGTIGAVGNNALGVVGVSWRTKIIACKFLDENNSGATSDAIECLDYVYDLKVNRDVDVVLTNNSWTGSVYSAALQRAIADQQAAGILLIAAAGNDTENTDLRPTYPASYDNDNIVSVAAIDRLGELASFSNWGVSSVDIAAPGVDVLTTKMGDRYQLYSGTSMAASHVSGMLLLYKNDAPSLDWRDLKKRLLESGKSLPSLVGKTVTGLLPKLDIAAADSDSDGMPDYWEQQYDFDLLDGDDAALDSDGDGLSNVEEFIVHTYPRVADSDGDGLSDSEEVNTYQTDPNLADTDGDGLNDASELIEHTTNPLLADTDGDGISDSWELAQGLDPLSSADGMADADGDGAANIFEFQAGTDPNAVDSTPSQGQSLWRIELDNSTYSAPAQAADGTVYIGAGSKLYAFSVIGVERWSYKFADTVSSLSPVVASDGTIYVGSNDGYLYAINPSGSLKWRFLVGSSLGAVAVAIGRDGSLYFGDSAGVFRALNAEGELKWQYYFEEALSDYSGSKPAIAADGTIYIASKGRYLLAFQDLGDEGRLKWQFDTTSYPSPELAIGDDGTIYLAASVSRYGGGKYYLYAVSPTGQMRWRYELNGGVSGGVSIDAEGRLYVGTSNAYFHVFSATGELLGSERSFNSGGFNAVPTAFADGRLLTGSLYVYHIDGSGNDNLSRWSYMHGRRSASALLTPQGVVFIATGDGALQALYAGEAQLASSAWPMYGNNPAHTGADADSDGDLMPDRWEDRYGLDKHNPDDGQLDADADGLSNLRELFACSNPLLADSDADGLGDEEELKRYLTSPCDRDSDQDGLGDEEEIMQYQTDPLAFDSDGDGLSDGWEIRHNLLPLKAGDAAIDLDNDGASNLVEFLADTDPLDASSLPERGAKLWSKRATGLIASLPVIAADGTVYVSRARKLYAYSPSGTLLWHYEAAEDVDRFSPVVDRDGTIYIGGDDKYLYAINADGTLKWRYLTASGLRHGSLSIGADGTLYVAAPSHYFLALNADGTLKWRYEHGGYMDHEKPAIAVDGSLYLRVKYKGLFAFEDIGDRAVLKWRFDIAGGTSSTVSIAADGTLYTGSGNGEVYAINPDGSQRWAYSAGGSVDGDISVGVDGSLYFNNDQHLYALSSAGELQWKHPLGVPSTVNITPTIAADGVIIVGSEYCIVDSNGVLASGHYGDDYSGVTSVISPQGVVYIVNKEYLHAFYDGSAGLADSPWPKYGKNSSNTGGDGDRDGDGMIDRWEDKYGLDALDPADKLQDLDGDGWTNEQEYRQGSSPIDSSSWPHLSTAEVPLALSAIDVGRYHEDGRHDPLSRAYDIKIFGSVEERNFFAFALPAEFGSITRAVVRVSMPAGGFLSTSGPGMFKLSEVMSQPEQVYSGGSLSVWRDLGDGAHFGDVELSSADEGGIVAIELNAAAIAYLSAKRGQEIVFGGSAADISNDMWLFNGGGDDEGVELMLTLVEDADNDGLLDSWEILHGLDPSNASDGLLDRDGDGLINLQEFLQHSDPNDADSDDDGLPDGYEFFQQFNPLDPAEGALDSDGDGISNAQEVLDATDALDDQSAKSSLDLTAVSLRDLVIAEAIKAGLGATTAAELNRYDINDDGRVDIADMILLHRGRAGL